MRAPPRRATVTDVREYLPTTWFDPRLQVQRSPVHGQGLFVDAPVAAGEVLMVWGGTLYTEDDLAHGRVPTGTSYSVVAPGQVLVGPSDGMDYFLNHSCDSDLWMDDEVTVSARRDLLAGQEVRLDYALVESEHGYLLVPCRCGTPICRGRVTGDDWRHADLQERYAGHFLPFLAR